MGLDSKVGIQLRGGSFSTNDGIFNRHPIKGTHWLCFIKDCYFDSYGFSPLEKKFHKTYKNKHGKGIYSEYQIQKIDSFFASYAFYMIYLTKVISIDFESGVLNLH